MRSCLKCLVDFKGDLIIPGTALVMYFVLLFFSYFKVDSWGLAIYEIFVVLVGFGLVRDCLTRSVSFVLSGFF